MKARVACVAALVGLVGLSAPTRAVERFYVGVTAGIFEPYGFQDAYDAIYGDTLTPVGAELEMALGERWFLALSTDFASSDGERVAFVPEPVPTGIATKLDLNPWRLTFGRTFRVGSPWTLRLGVGPTLLSWREESEIETVTGSDLGAHLLFGVRRGVGRFAFGAEAIYSTLPNALDGSGAAAQTGDDDLGGLALLATFGWRF